MSNAIRSALGMAVTSVACLILLYFLYGLIWFASVGWRKEQSRKNLFTGFAFGGVAAAIGLWFAARTSFESSMYSFERLSLVASIGFCLSAIMLARFGTKRTAVATIAGALIVALNAIGTLYTR